MNIIGMQRITKLGLEKSRHWKWWFVEERENGMIDKQKP